MKRPAWYLSLMLIVALSTTVILLAWQWRPMSPPDWSNGQIESMRSLWIGNLPPLPADPSNAVADDLRAARFGQALFFDDRLSGTGSIACSTCHQPVRNFSDGLRTAVALGAAKRNTPSIVGSAYSPWLYWDGRRDSQWAQALAPLEHPAEHGGNRLAYAHFIASEPEYRHEYEALFGPLPDLSDPGRFPAAASPLGTAAEVEAWRAMTPEDRAVIDRIFANTGKVIAAYERRLLHGPGRFDDYVAAVVAGDRQAQAEIFSTDEARGLALFLGKARCTECHNGPLLTNNEFHNTGILAAPGELPDAGRAEGLRELRRDPFNCAGPFNDDPDPYCGELEFAREGIELVGAFRTPSLRNLEHTAPYMHKGQLATLAEVVEHYNDAPLAMIGHNEAEDPLSLNARERRQLEAFLRTLSSPVAAEPGWLSPRRQNRNLSTRDRPVHGTR